VAAGLFAFAVVCFGVQTRGLVADMALCLGHGEFFSLKSKGLVALSAWRGTVIN